VTLFIENNVLSDLNFKNFSGKNPFLLTSFSDYKRLKKQEPSLKLLLDIAHLKVSCKSLKLDFFKQLESLLEEADYLHLSDNNSLADENLKISSDSDFLAVLKNHKQSLSSKEITLEVYKSLDDVAKTIESLINL